MKQSNKIASDLGGLYKLLLDREEELQPLNWLRVEKFDLQGKFPGLLGRFPKKTSARVIENSTADALTSEIKSHPGYVWLNQITAIHEGLEIVRQHSTEISDFPELLPLQQIRYWQTVALFFRGITTEQDVAPKTFSMSEKREIAKQAKQLSLSLRDGVGRFSSIRDWELRHSLDKLAADLEQPQKQDYAVKERERIYLLTVLAQGLILLDFKTDAPVVEILDRMCGEIDFVRSDRTLQRYVKDARNHLNKWRNDTNP